MEQISVRILDRDYRLAVPTEGKEQLIEAARAVDERMCALRDSGRVVGTDRIAVMAALQLANELVGLRQGGQVAAAPATEGQSEAVRRVRRLTAEIDAELRRQESLF
jgi:cell division protein ZapA